MTHRKLSSDQIEKLRRRMVKALDEKKWCELGGIRLFLIAGEYYNGGMLTDADMALRAAILMHSTVCNNAWWCAFARIKALEKQGDRKGAAYAQRGFMDSELSRAIHLYRCTVAELESPEESKWIKKLEKLRKELEALPLPKY